MSISIIFVTLIHYFINLIISLNKYLKMKKNLALIASFLITFGSTTHIVAQKKSKATPKQTKSEIQNLPINSGNDTLAYVYGNNLAEQGLKQYLEQAGIDINNSEKMEQFINGMYKGASASEEEMPHLLGLGVGNQILKMAEGFSQQTKTDNLNIQLVVNGLRDALLNKTPIISEPATVFQNKINEANQRAEKEKEKEYAAQIEAGNKFMEENKAKEGVVSLPSGLQYKVLTKGDGEIPTSSSVVKVHYKGMLTDGTEFDSSYKRNEPITLAVNQVIKGWVEGLQLMPVGSKWILYIPYSLGYGERGTGSIPPYSNLMFEIELLGIEE